MLSENIDYSKIEISKDFQEKLNNLLEERKRVINKFTPEMDKILIEYWLNPEKRINQRELSKLLNVSRYHLQQRIYYLKDNIK